ncbi:MAG: hypothetical protein H0X54_00310 [Propionibacteriales bacterium]|nr:hypothetical protein [Propionibacteriales bacterium]
MDLDGVADELYSLPAGEFIAARNNLAKQARAEGDRQLAEQIRALRRPSTAAWLANQLVREHRAEIEPLLELGRELREVMADLDAGELRELTQQRYLLVSALVKQGRALGAARGARVTGEVSQALRATLEATLSDPDSAQSLASGHLTEALSVSGFGSASDGAPPSSEPTSRDLGKGGSVSDLATKRQDKARQLAERVAEAEEAASGARVERDAAEDRLRSASRSQAEASAAVERLREQLTQADLELERQVESELGARQDSDTAKRKSEEAEQGLAMARAELKKMST